MTRTATVATGYSSGDNKISLFFRLQKSRFAKRLFYVGFDPLCNAPIMVL